MYRGEGRIRYRRCTGRHHIRLLFRQLAIRGTETRPLQIPLRCLGELLGYRFSIERLLSYTDEVSGSSQQCRTPRPAEMQRFGHRRALMMSTAVVGDLNNIRPLVPIIGMATIPIAALKHCYPAVG
jgi:hypothetical protein